MRLSKIEARRVFTRYGWQPISADAFYVSAGKAVVTLENEDYKMRIFESGAQKKLRMYAQVTDRRCKVAGARIEVTETGVKYDYSVIPSWHNVQRKIDALKELQKSIEGKAKFASEASPYIDCDTETGEQTEIVAIPRTSTTAIKITLGK